MRRKLLLLLLACAIVFTAATIVWRWQMRKLASAIRSLPVQEMETSSLAAFADLVLDASALNGMVDNRPILEQYKQNPRAVQHRAKLVATWMSASSIARYLPQTDIPVGKVVSSSELTQIPARYRVDGWNNSFCAFFDGKRAVVMSSGGQGPLACGQLEPVAKHASHSIFTEKLVRLQNIFVVAHTGIDKNEGTSSPRKREKGEDR